MTAPTPPEVREVAVLEEVARALHTAVIGSVNPDLAWKAAGPDGRANYRRYAAAAVTAYRATQDGGAEEAVDGNGCPDQPHHGVDCPGDACRYAPPVQQDDGEALHRDVCDLLNALNLGAYARPYSTHDVMQRDILPAIRTMHADRKRLEDFAIAMINAPDDSAADWGYDLAHLLDGDR